jgi:competence protein ComEC
VAFRIVHPNEPLATRANDRCCVLEVRSGDNRLVLTGDITSAVEGAVAAQVSADGKSLVLQVPHHGSRTSSSAEFIAALHPLLALVSTGYRNHFNHPNPAVVERYAAAGSGFLSTAQSGFVDLRFDLGVPPRIAEEGRVDRHPYWRE